MANDFNISLVAGLDSTKSKEKINQDIDTIRKSLKDLSIQAKIDPEQVKNLEGQLDSLKVKLSNVQITQPALDNLVKQINATLSGIKIGNINIGNQGQKVGQQIGQQIGQQVSQSISSAIQKGTMVNLKEFKFSGKLLQNDVAKKALEDFKALGQGIVTVKEEMKNIDGKTLLNGFTINIKNAKGEIESLKYALKDIEGKTGKSFQYIGGSINDAGAIKQIKDIENAFADYTARLAQFKSTNTNILSGLTQPLADFESKLAGLKNGAVTIDEVKNAFKLLGTEASKITENFTGQLSKTDAAIRKLAQGNEIMDKLKASFKGLNNAPKEITKELNSVSKLLQNVKKIESTEGRTANWSAEYRKWSDEVDKLKAKLSVLQKQQANMATPQVFKTSELRNADIPYMTKVSNTIEKQMVEIQKMANAKGWQKFEVKGVEETDGKIKALTLTIRDAEGALKQFTMQRAKLQGSGKAQTGLMQVGDVKVLETASQVQEKLAQSTEKANAKLAEQANKIQLSFANGNYKAKVESTIAKTQQWRDENGNARISTEQLRTALDNLGTAYNNLNADGGNTVENQKALKQAESELSAEIKKVTNEVTKMNAEYAKSSKVESFHQKLTEFYDKNSATHKKWGAELKQMMDATASGAKVTNSELLTMELRYKQIGNEARQAGKLGLSLFDGIKEQAKKFTQWVSITSVVMKSVQAVRGAVDNVIELDDALLELSKVSDLSTEGLENVTNQAYELGEKVGKTGTQVLDAITTFKRAGFDITQSTYLAEDALKMTNVAEGITDAADSAQYLISIMKVYKDTSDEFATKILDSINEVSNTQAVDFDNLADGAQRLSAVANQSGVSFEQMLGVLTGGYEVLGNMEKTASGLITIFTRLQSIQLSDEEDVESVAKLQETFSKATNGVVNIVDQSTGQLRSAFDILKDLNTVWDTLDKNTQEGLAFAAGGTRQKSVFLSIMNNWQSVENSIQSATNSMGSADVENSKYLDSISGKVSQFDSVVQKLSKDVINSDLVKFFVDLGTIGVKAIDGLVNSLTPLGTLSAGIGLFTGIKNVGIGMLVAY